MRYRLSDAFQASVGVFSATLLFVSLKSEPLIINPIVGLVITIIWVSLFYNGRSGLAKENFFIDLGITFVIAGVLTLVFSLATLDQLLSFNYFGSTSIILVWLGFPISILMDKWNLTNILKRHYIRK